MSEPNWTGIFPFKGGTEGKSRLSASEDERQRLAWKWLGHVLQCARICNRFSRLLVVSQSPLWLPDDVENLVQSTAGLNPGLEEARASAGPRAVIVLPDLPHLQPAELQLLVDMCPEPGLAIAPDRHGTGTNAVAMQSVPQFECAFGVDSFARHCRQARDQCIAFQVIHAEGLGHDIDTEADLNCQEA